MLRRNLFSGLAAAIGLAVAPAIASAPKYKPITYGDMMRIDNQIMRHEIDRLEGVIKTLNAESARRREELIKDVMYFAEKAKKERRWKEAWREKYDALRG